MKESKKEGVAQALYATWARKMGDEKPFPWEELEASEREAWLDVAEKAGESLGRKDVLIRRSFLLMRAILGPGHDTWLMIKWSGKDFVVKRYGDQSEHGGETITAATRAMVEALEAVAAERQRAAEEDVAQWRGLLGSE